MTSSGPTKSNQPASSQRSPASNDATKPNYHHGNLRAELLSAAGSILSTSGMQALSLRRVADEVNVSRTAPYRHFANKEALLAGLASAGFQQLREALLSSIDTHPDAPEKQFYAGCQSYAQFGAGRPCLYRLMFGHQWTEGEHPELEETATAAFQVLVNSIMQMQQAGLAKSGDAIEYAMTVWSTMHGLVHLWIDGKANRFDEKNLEQQLHIILTNLLHGLQ